MKKNTLKNMVHRISWAPFLRSQMYLFVPGDNSAILSSLSFLENLFKSFCVLSVYGVGGRE